MIKKKTISGHYGTSYSLSHNNRAFLSKNVDPSRTKNNFNPVVAGDFISDDFPNYKDMNTLWKDYRALTECYWREYSIESYQINQQIKGLVGLRQDLQSTFRKMATNPIAACIVLLLAPFLVLNAAELLFSYSKELKELKTKRCSLFFSKECFKEKQISVRNALKLYDRSEGTKLLAEMDALVWSAEVITDTHWKPHRFATLDEIYTKLYEPGFRTFQAKQRPCRRYNGTYLEQIRENQSKHSQRHGKKENSRLPAEAIEIIFSIGDMDNTGYSTSPTDAHRSESILNDFCRHLLANRNICTVTTKELNDPNWQPPFKNGLILLNLVAHYDEATPGIHMTAIPYSRGCTRGPNVQPSLSRAMTGMGYPTTWLNRLDEAGHPIPKRNRKGEIIYEKDGSIRYQKEPDKQGIIDWIEDQKQWIQREMKIRYNWEREYKGGHPGGYLSIPDYQIARAKERLAELDRQANSLVNQAKHETQALLKKVNADIDKQDPFYTIIHYLEICPDERFEEILNEASKSLSVALNEKESEIRLALQDMLERYERDKQKERTVHPHSHDGNTDR